MVKPYSRPAADEPAWWFVVSSDQILLTEDNDLPFGCLADLSFPSLDDYTVVQIGELRERSCYLVIADYLDDNFVDGKFEPLRQLLDASDLEKFAMAGRARQFSDFISTHRFCGRCGTRMQAVDWELAMHCHQCNHRCYPRVSPCIIVAITKGEQLLLAQGKRHKQGMYSILAGFVEAGESLEQALAREVHEEAGIQVQNIEYQLSQPWPFPHSLMMGFTAEWAGGELHIDPHELVTGDWFDFDDLPPTPPAGTIAHTLIEKAIGKKAD
ncbi:NAD(+) diphosphatase [Idiomarina seosinensis]|uniref:NAD-capped RNA hydrolase NudC n=1 Tax=Idiomarina seosinensis TaxID=281739 RepID=A0A432Z7D5_9GAMM|nr:NAD(+) diphosphatase [Idiomarina seosinensis]RUO73743.1 NAD(+) diphosphatase [Idiomarina seosinensis]